MLKIISNLFLIIFIAGLEESNLMARIFLNPYLCFLIFFTLSKDRLAFLWPILGGIIFDYFSIFRFPIFTLSFLLTSLLIKFINEKIFAFGSFISLIIFSFGGIISYNLIFLALNTLAYFLKIENTFIVINSSYFFYLFSNSIFTLLLLIFLRKKYGRSIF